MTTMEIKKRIEELEEREFYINMVDFWTTKDRKMLREIQKEKEELQKKLH